MSLREERVEYIHLPAGSPLPPLEPTPRRVIVIVDQDVTSQWQDEVSEWIVDSGCLYMMAWGRDCSSWDDSVDWANLKRIGGAELTDDNHVMTTWHADEPMSEVFFYCLMCAFHPTLDLHFVTILDVNEQERSSEIISAYNQQHKSLELGDSE
ncbi:MAG: hypothetical protein CVT75_04445 [Alphaproteobacteria bacterium HGW-Alphaproteobacteria-14]|nr:MAG: hypothetical protein CVT75_04445 [Alphaproteobacteria bacterium HGW-Alphaproteobacteria-14]